MTQTKASRVVENRLKQDILGEPKLVWRPSRESASPLQPLYQIAVDGGDVFVDVNGSVHEV
jgi:hypothetical protein